MIPGSPSFNPLGPLMGSGGGKSGKSGSQPQQQVTAPGLPPVPSLPLPSIPTQGSGNPGPTTMPPGLTGLTLGGGGFQPGGPMIPAPIGGMIPHGPPPMTGPLGGTGGGLGGLISMFPAMQQMGLLPQPQPLSGTGPFTPPLTVPGAAPNRPPPMAAPPPQQPAQPMQPQTPLPGPNQDIPAPTPQAAQMQAMIRQNMNPNWHFGDSLFLSPI